ncbi:MAG TPA: ATP-binding protein [Burkholderiales bacterium]|nr:ATP-binding protein [Burkholderiales bacterium]
MKAGIRTKLFLMLLGAMAAAVIVVDVYLTNALDRQLTDRIRDDLLVRAALVAERAQSSPAALNDHVAWDAIADELGRLSRTRVTLIGSDGRVLGDSEVASGVLDALEDHATRPEVLGALAAGQGWSVRYSTTVKQRMMYVAVPFQRGQSVLGVARIAMPLTDVDRAIAELRKTIAVASLLALAVAILLAAVAARLTSTTLRQLTEAARSMAGGNLHARTRVAGHDEIATLGQALNRLAENLSATLANLRSERDLFDAVLSSMQEGILVVGADGKIVLVNRSLREMFLLEADCAGKSVLQAMRNVALSALLEEARRGPAAAVDLESGGLKPRRLLVHAVQLAGVPGGVLAVFLDVTELRRLESLRRDFVANASHELRTPIAAVRGAAETLRAALDDREAVLRFTEIIERNSERLERLIADLLELSRVESSRFQFTLEPVDLADVVQYVTSLHRHRAEKKGIALDAQLPAPSPAVRADRRALEMVFGNLLDNAIKYCPENARITMHAIRAGNEVRVSVTDSGPGIEPRHLPRLFERFYRVDAGRSRELGGTGLGLAIVKHLVEAMGGTVTVESAVGAGTTFSFTLLHV